MWKTPLPYPLPSDIIGGMIPLHNKELLIKNLKAGYTIIEACKASQVSKATLYRLFKEQPGFKADVEKAIFEAKDVSKEIEAQVQQRNMDKIKGIINRKRD